LAPPEPAQLLFRSFRAAPRRSWRVLHEVNAIYQGVFPCALTDEDLRSFLGFLYLAVRILRPRVIVQTGTAIGTSTVAIALALRDNGAGRIWTIDPEPDEYFGIGDPVAAARKAVGRARLEANVTFVRGYSTVPLDSGRMRLPDAPTWQLTRLPPYGAIEMLVIDGDHTFLGCYLDLSFGSAGLSSHGPRALVCHDYNGIPHVRRAVRLWRQTQQVRVERTIPSRCGIKFFQL
jgi:methyltransferase family protein